MTVIRSGDDHINSITVLFLVLAVLALVHFYMQKPKRSTTIRSVVTQSYVKTHEPYENRMGMLDTCDIPELSDCVNDEDWGKECAND
jgi:hypothetical protein